MPYSSTCGISVAVVFIIYIHFTNCTQQHLYSKNIKTKRNPIILKTHHFYTSQKRYHILQTQLTNIFKEMAVFIYYFYQWLINKIKVFSFVVLISFKIMYYYIGRNKSNGLLSHPLSKQFYWSVMNESPNCLLCALFMHTGMLVLATLIVRLKKKKKKDSKAAGVGKLRSFAKEGQNLGCAEQL